MSVLTDRTCVIAIAQKRRGTVLAVAPMSGRKSKEKDESGEKRAVARALCKRVLPVTQQFSYRSNPINGVLRSMQLKSAFSSALSVERDPAFVGVRCGVQAVQVQEVRAPSAVQSPPPLPACTLQLHRARF